MRTQVRSITGAALVFCLAASPSMAATFWSDPLVEGSGIAIETRGGTVAGIHVINGRTDVALATFAGAVEKNLIRHADPLASHLIERSVVDYVESPGQVLTRVEFERALGVITSTLTLSDGAGSASFLPFDFGHESELSAWAGDWSVVLHALDGRPELHAFRFDDTTIEVEGMPARIGAGIGSSSSALVVLDAQLNTLFGAFETGNGEAVGFALLRGASVNDALLGLWRPADASGALVGEDNLMQALPTPMATSEVAAAKASPRLLHVAGHTVRQLRALKASRDMLGDPVPARQGHP